VAAEGRCSTLSSSLTLFRWATMRSVGRTKVLRVVLFSMVLVAIGCGANGGTAISKSEDQPGETKTDLRSHGPAAGQKPKTEQGSGKASIAKKNPQRTGPQTTALSTPNLAPKRLEPQSIPGMNADAVLITFLKPGLECWQPLERGVLYNCSSEENQKLTLLYEGKITGRTTDQVSGVEARVFRRGTEDFEQASQPFLGLLATQLKYRGANKEQAYEFVNHNLSSVKATTTIGGAKWTIIASDDSKQLTITPA
jgi:hypothetical protein